LQSIGCIHSDGSVERHHRLGDRRATCRVRSRRRTGRAARRRVHQCVAGRSAPPLAAGGTRLDGVDEAPADRELLTAPNRQRLGATRCDGRPRIAVSNRARRPFRGAGTDLALPGPR
jgi:hypothetical protein